MPYGTVASGQSVSSAFVLFNSDRALAVAVSSHALLSWFASFTATASTAGVTPSFLRYADPWSALSGGAMFTGFAGGGWGVVATPPAQLVRIETSAAVSATTSFFLIEVVG